MGSVPRVPHLKAEWRLWQEGRRFVVGVDEVGMGALCAPVLAAAVLVRPNTRKIAGVRDSKTLSAVQRERLATEIGRRSLAWGIGAASVAEIERLNIYHASHLAMKRALARIPVYDHVLVDGRKIVGFEGEVGPYTSIVDGDATSYAIACASIIAKVTRDRLMRLLAARYPGYGWERNAGYATADHVAGLQRLGITPFHRRGYQRIRAMLEGEQLTFDLGDAPPTTDADALPGAPGTPTHDVPERDVRSLVAIPVQSGSSVVHERG
jgi:ribonuclease HII